AKSNRSSSSATRAGRGTRPALRLTPPAAPPRAAGPGAAPRSPPVPPARPSARESPRAARGSARWPPPPPRRPPGSPRSGGPAPDPAAPGARRPPRRTPRFRRERRTQAPASSRRWRTRPRRRPPRGPAPPPARLPGRSRPTSRREAGIGPPGQEPLREVEAFLQLGDLLVELIQLRPEYRLLRRGGTAAPDPLGHRPADRAEGERHGHSAAEDENQSQHVNQHSEPRKHPLVRLPLRQHPLREIEPLLGLLEPGPERLDLVSE